MISYGSTDFDMGMEAGNKSGTENMWQQRLKRMENILSSLTALCFLHHMIICGIRSLMKQEINY